MLLCILVFFYRIAYVLETGVVKVGGVNADVEKSLGSQYGIQGFPTIKIFHGKKVEDYNGGRTAKDIVDAALRAVRTKVEAQLGGKTSGGGNKSTLENKLPNPKIFEPNKMNHSCF